MNRYGEFFGYDGVSLKDDGEFVLYDDYKHREAVLQADYKNLQARYHVAAQLHAEALVDLQRQLAEVTRERDTLKAMLTLTEAQRDRLLNAARKLATCKGRYHTEQNFKALVAELENQK